MGLLSYIETAGKIESLSAVSDGDAVPASLEPYAEFDFSRLIAHIQKSSGMGADFIFGKITDAAKRSLSPDFYCDAYRYPVMKFYKKNQADIPPELLRFHLQHAAVSLFQMEPSVPLIQIIS